jgi:molybdate transport repressor ModE-like protein
MSALLQPKVLRYLSAVAQHGSVQAAAREVSISASAIDRQILILETHLGMPLFERQPRGMRLTAAGEVLLALGQRWKTDLNRTLSDIKQLQGVSQGQLKLAAMDSHTNGLLPEFIKRVAVEHPGIALDVEIVTTDEAANHLAQGAVDLAVAFNLKSQPDLHRVRSAELPLGCVVAASHPLAAHQSVMLEEVVVWPLAAQSRVLAIRRYLEQRHNWILNQANPPLVTNSLQLVKSLVMQGDYVALTSELDAGPEILAGTLRFIPLRDKNIAPQTVVVAINAVRPLPRIARIVADLLADHVDDYLARIRRAQPIKKPA